jgi:8-oxo-dGTP pyrophosphatase MutT (NUDIX family)
MSNQRPRVTVATVICHEGRYLLVEERDKTTGELVFNQPAGHLEPGESLQQGALRETLEETGWQVQLSGFLGIALYTAANGVTYCRNSFLARPIRALENASLDPDIVRIHWLSYEEIVARSDRMRSPLVLLTIEQQRQGVNFPLDLIYA